jgi:hypothetical protein
MEIIINIDEAAEKMQLGKRIAFGSLDYFIVDRFGDLQLQELKPPWRRSSLPRSAHSSLDWRKLWMLGLALLPNT